MESPLSNRQPIKRTTEVVPTVSKFGKIEINLDLAKKDVVVTSHSRNSSNMSDVNMIKDKKVNFKIEDQKTEKIIKGKPLKGKKLS